MQRGCLQSSRLGVANHCLMKHLFSLFFLMAVLNLASGQATAVQIRIDSTFDYRNDGLQVFPLDFNGDGTAEFDFQYLQDNLVLIAHIGTSNGNGQVLRSGFNLRSLAMGVNVGASSTSYDNTSELNPSGFYENFRIVFAFCNSFSCNSNGSFTNATNRYIGVRFRADEASEWYYGYVGITANVTQGGIDDGFVTINSIGYNTEPGLGVLTGSGEVITSSLWEETPQPISVYPNPTNGIITLDASLALADVQLISNTGQTLLHTAGGNNTVNITHVPPGNYLLRVTDNNGKLYVQRVVKQ